MSRLFNESVREILEESGSDFSDNNSIVDPEYHPEPRDLYSDSDEDNEPLSVLMSTPINPEIPTGSYSSNGKNNENLICMNIQTNFHLLSRF